LYIQFFYLDTLKNNSDIMNKLIKRTRGGFTLIEILIVIGIIAILAAIVLVAINPSRQFAQANNTQRSSNVNAILNAVGQYAVDHKGDLTDLDIDGTPTDISDGGADICDDLVPRYLPSLPTDPLSDDNGASVDCSTGYDTDYQIEIDDDGRVVVSAPKTEDLGEETEDEVDTISVTR
jgi:prepilin-type N-terminal cleavage/methylation domain-containing protein